MLDSSDTRVVQQAFELFAPHRGARRQVEALLADSVRHAHEEGNSCWEITLRPRELVFNVGQVALLIIGPNLLSLGSCGRQPDECQPAGRIQETCDSRDLLGPTVTLQRSCRFFVAMDIARCQTRRTRAA